MTTRKLKALFRATVFLYGGFAALLAAAESPDVNSAASRAAAIAPDHSVGLFYSFDSKPEAGTVEQMQRELRRILLPSGVAVTWHAIDDNRGNLTFAEVLVIRFRGSCEMSNLETPTRVNFTGTHELAETRRADGRVLPFGEVQCDELRRYLSPSLSSERSAVRKTLFGRAMARVVAHEIFHMVTGSAQHSKQGIARATHSRRDLTAERFDFDTADTEWLRNWKDRALIPAEPSTIAETATPIVTETVTDVAR